MTQAVQALKSFQAQRGEVIMRFDKVSFAYRHNKPILNEVDFSVRQGSKITLMGQNGAGKSTIFNLIMGTVEPESGHVHRATRITVAAARQTISRDQLHLTVREFFERCFSEANLAKAQACKGKIYDIDPRIDEVLEVMNLVAPHDRIIKSFSGGQQARLLLASALIQNPDLLLLDEPTNNLDKDGISHLTQFLIDYKKTCIVISHDANFLNAFTHGVLYLDVFTRKIEQYVGNYFDLVAELLARIEKENRKNAQLEKKIQEKRIKRIILQRKAGICVLWQKKCVRKRKFWRRQKLMYEERIKPFGHSLFPRNGI